MIELVLPTVDLADSWLAGKDEFPPGAVLHGYSDHAWAEHGLHGPGGAARLVQSLRDGERGIGLPEGWVPCTTYWIIDSAQPERVLGSLALRHHLDNDFLLEYGGHIGYGVRPSERRRGVASAALHAALPRARALGLDQVMLTCDDANLPSRATIETCGGIFERMAGQRRRYWIAT